MVMERATRLYFPNAAVRKSYTALPKHNRMLVRNVARQEALARADDLDFEPHLYCIHEGHVARGAKAVITISNGVLHIRNFS